MILTEEELTYIHDDIYGSLDPSEREKLLKLLDSHRELFKANAELSFKNMKFKEVIDKVWKHALAEGVAINNLQNALEELK